MSKWGRWVLTGQHEGGSHVVAAILDLGAAMTTGRKLVSQEAPSVQHSVPANEFLLWSTPRITDPGKKPENSRLPKLDPSWADKESVVRNEFSECSPMEYSSSTKVQGLLPFC